MLDVFVQHLEGPVGSLHSVDYLAELKFLVPSEFLPRCLHPALEVEHHAIHSKGQKIEAIYFNSFDIRVRYTRHITSFCYSGHLP